MNINFDQGSTKRGLIRVVVAIAAAWAWWSGNTEQAIGAFTVGEALKGWVGITQDEAK